MKRRSIPTHHANGTRRHGDYVQCLSRRLGPLQGSQCAPTRFFLEEQNLLARFQREARLLQAEFKRSQRSLGSESIPDGVNDADTLCGRQLENE